MSEDINDPGPEMPQKIEIETYMGNPREGDFDLSDLASWTDVAMMPGIKRLTIVEEDVREVLSRKYSSEHEDPDISNILTGIRKTLEEMVESVYTPVIVLYSGEGSLEAVVAAYIKYQLDIEGIEYDS